MSGRWVDATDLRPGDELLLRDGGDGIVETVEHIPADTVVYNFSVDELKCYAVGSQGILVHNTNGSEGAADALNASKLAARADEIHAVLDHPAAINGRTTAVLQTNKGNIVAGGVRDLSPAQRLALKPGEIAVKLPGEHAEITALQAALGSRLQLLAIGTSRDFCPECIAALKAAGATITGLRTAIWR